MIGQKSTERNIYFSDGTSQEVKNEIKNLQNQITTIDGEIDDINGKLQGTKEPDGSTVWVSTEDKLSACGSKTANGGVMFSSNVDLNTDLSNNSITNGNNIHLESNNNSYTIANGYVINVSQNNSGAYNIINGDNITISTGMANSFVTGHNVDIKSIYHSIVVGNNIDASNYAIGSSSGLIGNNLTLNNNVTNGLLIGGYNANFESSDVFIVANGTSTNKNNMVTCKRNGNIVLSNANIYNTSNQLLSHILDTGIGLSPINSDVTINYQHGINFDTNLVLLVANVTLTVTDALASGSELMGLIGTTKQFGAFTKTYLCNNVDQKIIMNWDNSARRFKLGTNLSSGTYEFDMVILQPLY